MQQFSSNFIVFGFYANNWLNGMGLVMEMFVTMIVMFVVAFALLALVFVCGRFLLVFATLRNERWK